MVTASRVLPWAAEMHNLWDLSQVSRQQMANVVLNAVQQPLTNAGRPRNEERGVVDKLAASEACSDGFCCFL